MTLYYDCHECDGTGVSNGALCPPCEGTGQREMTDDERRQATEDIREYRREMAESSRLHWESAQ